MHYTGKVTCKETGKPLAGVPVSDGRNIILTAADGSYSLPGWERNHMVWVGMLTKAHDDWYYFTDGKAGTYDFAISPAKSESFEVLQISDTENANDKDVTWAGFLGEHVRKETSFIMHTGDITRREGIASHREVMNYETMGCPVRYVIGNHDFALATDASVRYGEQVYEEEAGPAWYSFDSADVHCVVLSIGRGSSGDMATGYTKEDQWTWLKNDLETLGKGKSVVIFEHSAGPDPRNFIVGDLDLKQYGVVAWIYGHDHTNLHHIRNGIHSITTNRPHTGGIDASPACLRRILVENGQVRSEMIYRRFPVAAADEAVWQTKVPGSILLCEPVLRDGNLYIGSMADGLPNQSGLSCLDAATGKEKWFFAAKGNGLVNNFSLDGDCVYLQDTMGWVYCLNATTGEEIWETELYLVYPGKTKMPAVVAGDLVVAGASMKIYGLDKKTGETLWFSKAMKKGEQTAARTVYAQKQDYVIHNAQWGVLICLNAQTGEEVWQRNDKPLTYRNNTPCVDGDAVYTGGFGTMVKLNIHTGETLLEVDVQDGLEALGRPEDCCNGNVNVCGSAAVDGDVLYCPTACAGVVAIEKNTMQVLRRFPVGATALLTAPYVKRGAQMVESRPVIRGDKLIFTAMDGKVYIYNKHTAEKIKTIHMSAPSLVAPIVTDDAIYTADFDGNICKFSV